MRVNPYMVKPGGAHARSKPTILYYRTQYTTMRTIMYEYKQTRTHAHVYPHLHITSVCTNEKRINPKCDIIAFPYAFNVRRCVCLPWSFWPSIKVVCLSCLATNFLLLSCVQFARHLHMTNKKNFFLWLYFCDHFLHQSKCQSAACRHICTYTD